MDTPLTGPPTASRLTGSPTRPSSTTSSRTTWTRARSTTRSTFRADQRSDAATSRLARAWSNRPPAEVTTVTMSAPASTAAARANSKSVTSLSTGCCATVLHAAKVSSDTESRSPTSRSTVRPRAIALSAPRSAAITMSASGSRPMARGGGPPVTTRTRWPLTSCLHQRGPTSVPGSGRGSPRRRSTGPGQFQSERPPTGRTPRHNHRP